MRIESVRVWDIERKGISRIQLRRHDKSVKQWNNRPTRTTGVLEERWERGVFTAAKNAEALWYKKELNWGCGAWRY